jgi:hypothetical protein
MADRPVRWRWTLYGLAVGVVICVAAFVLEDTSNQFESWPWPRIVRNAGFAATVLIFGTVGLVAGIIRD